MVDPFAAHLCGAEGLAIGRALEAEGRAHDAIAIRTRVIDERLALAAARDGLEEVVLLGAGLDARAHRLSWPEALRFLECDHEALLAWKRVRLGELAARVGYRSLDLRDLAAVEALFAELGPRRRVVVLEGVVAYLEEPVARALLGVIARAPGRARVIADVGGGAWSALFGRRIPATAERAGAPYRTRIAHGRRFFEEAGLHVEADVSLVAWDAARPEPRFRLPWITRLMPGVRDVARVIDAVSA